MRAAWTDFTSPLGVIGVLVERVVLASYLTGFLERRAAALKRLAEAGAWKPDAPGLVRSVEYERRDADTSY